ncbi:endolytic transglycosylase MltG [Isoptericola sp. NEAU-Y5]|uniref:Endolytic murein transglycosylase n=1 Tax=Isoptericola luteus TaxID=2879484 RepID=A0ABS7ZLY3_9MICO|nr:endolytic transglycosylase MltG [Isoptericola sp. NEAU-Y5]MCA5894669.1 endolytic transglycosylase MltG [Isoptericola sp. NEAU-Y5]
MTDLFEHPALQQPPAPSSRSRSSAGKRAAAKRRRRRQQRTAVVLVVVLGVVGAGGYLLWDQVDDFAGDLAFWNSSAEDYPGPGGEAVEVVIPEGATGGQMGGVLHDAGVVASVDAFTQAFGANPAASGIQPGTYQLLSQMKASDAVAALVKNEKVQTDVTIPEGYTVAQIVDRVASVTTITAEELEAALEDWESIGLPKQADGNAEGWLFPKTYTVQPDDDATSLLSAMVEQTKAELEEAGVDKADWEETLIIASLIEREAKHDEDRPKMVRAILNRIEQGMPLQIDATSAYGLNKPGTELSSEDVRNADDPYSTYAHVGLPPTPISNPGAASIDAVGHPADGDWLFWITVNLDTGETKFSSTNAQHEEYRQELRAWQAENGS